MMRNKYTLVLLSLLLAFALPAGAQQAAGTRIEGTVTDVDNNPLAGAMVAPYLGDTPMSSGAAITDGAGKFTITLPEGANYRVSFTNFQTQTINSREAVQTIVLRDQLKELEQVIAVGYRNTSLANSTGANAVIHPDEIKDLMPGDLANSLRGLVPGLEVTKSSNRPGDMSTMVVRNADMNYFGNKYKSGTQIQKVTTPLYVIDEFISDEDTFNMLNPNEIETIVILKDAEAAVYGVNGARGVILVTTKRGQVGAAKISYSGQFGFSDALKHPKMLDSYTYGRMWNAAVRASDRVPQDNVNYSELMFSQTELERMKGMNYDLLKQYWSPASKQSHNINLSGGTENATFFSSISYFTEDGNLGRLDYDQWGFRSGLNARLGQHVRAGIQVSGNFSQKESSYNTMTGASWNSQVDYRILLFNPRYIPDYVGEGEQRRPIVRNGIDNSSATSQYQNYHFDVVQNSENYRRDMPSNLGVNLSLEYDFNWSKILTGLSTRVNYSKSISTDKTNISVGNYTIYRMLNRLNGEGVSSRFGHLYTGPEADYSDTNFETMNLSSGGGSASVDAGDAYIRREMSRADSYQLQWRTTYVRSFGLHNVDALFVIEKSENESEDLWGRRDMPFAWSNGQSNTAARWPNAPNPDKPEDNAINAGKDPAGWTRSEGGRLAYVAQAGYNYDSKYLFNVTLRVDASTKFAPDNYWGAFPSFGLGWVISEEPWMKSRTSTNFDFLKVRATFGLMGADNISAWAWKYSYTDDVAGAKFGTGTTPANQGMGISYGNSRSGESQNPGAHWDKSYKSNFGVDTRMFRGRLSLGVDFYYNWNRDMFTYFSGTELYSGVIGAQAAPENYGAIDNWGVEFSAGWRGMIGDNFNYRINANTSWGDNKIVKAPVPTGGMYELQQPRIGESTDMGDWGMESLGMFRSYQEITEYFDKYAISSYLGLGQRDIHPGMLIYRDVRGQRLGDSNTPEWVAANPDKVDRFGWPKDPDGRIVAAEDLVQINKRGGGSYMQVNLNFGGSYRNVWSFSGQMNFRWGGYAFIPQTARGTLDIGKNSITDDYKMMMTSNMPSFWKDMFVYDDVYDAEGRLTTPANRDGKWPNLRYTNINAQNSTFWKVSGFSAMLRNLTVAYSVPNRYTDYIGISSARLNLTVQNVLNFTNPYPDNFISGFEGVSYGSYPLTRVFQLGVSVSF